MSASADHAWRTAGAHVEVVESIDDAGKAIDRALRSDAGHRALLLDVLAAGTMLLPRELVERIRKAVAA